VQKTIVGKRRLVVEHIQTGNMLDVVVDGKDIGLYPRGLIKDFILWLPDPQGVVDVLQTEINRLKEQKEDAKSNKSAGTEN
jgi:hypothetical protein